MGRPCGAAGLLPAAPHGREAGFVHVDAALLRRVQISTLLPDCLQDT